MEKRLKIQLSRVESRGYKYRWERTKSGKNSKIRWSSNHYEKETIGTWSPLTEIESKRIRINTEIPRSAVQWNIWARKRHGSNLSNRSQFSDLAAKRGGGGQRFDQRLLSINRRSSWAERHMKPDFFASPKSREEGIGGGGGEWTSSQNAKSFTLGFFLNWEICRRGTIDWSTDWLPPTKFSWNF